jgi:hypothetical protein
VQRKPYIHCWIYPTSGCHLHDWTMTYNVSMSLGTAACRSAVASKSSPSRKVANESQSFYLVTTVNTTTVQLPTRHVGCQTSTSEKEDETGWKIVHRAELCGTERPRRIPLRLKHDSPYVHVILHSRQRPRSSPESPPSRRGQPSHRSWAQRTGFSTSEGSTSHVRPLIGVWISELIFTNQFLFSFSCEI